MARLRYVNNSKQATSSQGRKNLPAGLSISSSQRRPSPAVMPRVLEVDALNARWLAEIVCGERLRMSQFTAESTAALLKDFGEG